MSRFPKTESSAMDLIKEIARFRRKYNEVKKLVKTGDWREYTTNHRGLGLWRFLTHMNWGFDTPEYLANAWDSITPEFAEKYCKVVDIYSQYSGTAQDEPTYSDYLSTSLYSFMVEHNDEWSNHIDWKKTDAEKIYDEYTSWLLEE